MLFDIPIRLLDTPPTGKSSDDRSAQQRQIGREEKVVPFLALGVAADDQQHRGMADLVPQNHSGIHQTGSGVPPFASPDAFPGTNLSSHLFRAGQSSSPFAGPAPLMGFPLRRQFVQHRIPSEAGDQVNPGRKRSGQRGIESIGMYAKIPFRKGFGDFPEHLHSQVGQGIAFLAMDLHADRQAQRHSTPGGRNPQSQDHQIQAPAIDDPVAGRANRVPPPPGSFDLGAGTMKEGIVQIQQDGSGRGQDPDQVSGQKGPHRRQVPPGVGEKAMVDVVGPQTRGIGKGKDAGEGVSTGAEDPAHRQSQEDRRGRLGENRKKLLDDFGPSRYRRYCSHTNLPNSDLSNLVSEGWYGFDYRQPDSSLTAFKKCESPLSIGGTI